ncbi:NAD(P)/FAD-dependent oxidoreductase [Flavobacteriaceae bacterium M23B6Z8]
MNHYDLIIIGGGLAGLTAALHVSKANYKVLLIEKYSYPNHKVCGEYVSKEIIPYLNRLDVSLEKAGAVSIDKFMLSTKEGAYTQTTLPLGGLGISRYAFDELLYNHALTAGAEFVFDTVTTVTYHNETFHIKTASNIEFTATTAIGAFGKRSNLDKKLDRDFMHLKSNWLGVKAHYQLESFPDDLVALHNFEGGYGGLSKTETGAVNFCYLTTYKSFEQYNNIDAFNNEVVAKNPFLNEFLEKSVPLFEKPISIAQISFRQKLPVENHLLMCGDAAGLIHPLCGNGMAMAIHSAKIASELILLFLSGKIEDRKVLEKTYSNLWNTTFRRRLWMGRKLQSLLLSPTSAKYAMRLASSAPPLLRGLISYTHGKPIAC